MTDEVVVTGSRYNQYGYGYANSGGGISEQPEANGTYLNPTLTPGTGAGVLQWQGAAEKLSEVVVSKIVEELVEKGIDAMFGPDKQQVVNTEFSRKADNDPNRKAVTLVGGLPAVKFSDGSYFIDRNKDGKMDLKLTQIGDDVYVDYGDGDGYKRLKAVP